VLLVKIGTTVHHVIEHLLSHPRINLRSHRLLRRELTCWRSHKLLRLHIHRRRRHHRRLSGRIMYNVLLVHPVCLPLLLPLRLSCALRVHHRHIRRSWRRCNIGARPATRRYQSLVKALLKLLIKFNCCIPASLRQTGYHLDADFFGHCFEFSLHLMDQCSSHLLLVRLVMETSILEGIDHLIQLSLAHHA
jgi:hypothetical protein